jgi:hypothetical protein
VLTWRIAMSPRPRFSTGGRHWWRDYVTETFRAADNARAALRESGGDAGGHAAGAAGSNAGYYQLTDEEFDAQHPRPRLKDFMVALSQGATAPDRLDFTPA